MTSATFSIEDTLLTQFKEFCEKNNKDKNREIERLMKNCLDSREYSKLDKKELEKKHEELLLKKQELFNQTILPLEKDIKNIQDRIAELDNTEKQKDEAEASLSQLQKDLEDATIDYENYRKNVIDVIPIADFRKPEYDEMRKIFRAKAQLKYDIEQKIREAGV